MAFCLAAVAGQAQIPSQMQTRAPVSAPVVPNAAPAPVPVRPNAPAADEVRIAAVTQEREGVQYRLRGAVHIETIDMLLKADEVDYNEETGDVDARGNVYFKNFSGGEELYCDRVEYNLNSELGKYYQVRGTSPAKIDARPGILTSTNPFSFQGKWAERLADRYILHEGTITNCKVPKPWWTLEGPSFDIIPGERAIARNSIFRFKKVPLFYTPFFYKSLQRMPRRSGLLAPNIGNSSRRGFMLGGGYYWAINRSYDLMYRTQYFSTRGFAHTVDFRGKPTQRADFNFFLYGVGDRGRLLDDGTRVKEGGYLITADGRAELGRGFRARGNFNYLSSFVFRQAFTESFFEAIFSEVHTTMFITRRWSTFTLNGVYEKNENFITADKADRIVTRKSPYVEFNSSDRELVAGDKPLPVWVSWRASGGFVRRNQRAYTTRNFVDRLDLAPEAITALRWKSVHLTPRFGLRGTHYGSSFDDEGRITGTGLWRNSREFGADLVLPSLGRVFDTGRRTKWLGTKLKHVIEPRASYRYVTGIEDFRRIIRFDESDLLSNTNEAEFTLTNRLFSKKADGRVMEVLSWSVTQQRYFDPTFGGAVQPGVRNVVLSSAMLSSYAFIDDNRRFSPIVSNLRMTPVEGFGIEWRADYDPLRGHFVNSGFTADGRFSRNYVVSIGHNQVRSSSVLQPNANQLRGMVGFGQENKRGWNAGFIWVYEFRDKVLQFATTQVTYNTDCCGFSFQYRRFSFGTRNENQFRGSLQIANIGSFGTLRRQERIF